MKFVRLMIEAGHDWRGRLSQSAVQR